MKKVIIIGASGGIAAKVISMLERRKDVQLTLLMRSVHRLRKPPISGTRVVEAMLETGVRRVILISSVGIYDTPLRSVLKPYRAAADVIETSGLDYTVLRPTWFTDVDEVDYEITHKGEPEKGSVISQKSLASFIVEIIENPEQYIGESLGINKPE